MNITDINGKVRSKKEPSRFISHIEKTQLLDILKERHEMSYLYVSIAFQTGLRLNEIPQYVEACQQKHVGDNVDIKPLKKGRKRVIPVMAVAHDAFKYINNKPETVQRNLNKLFKATFSMHDCRHTFATNMANVLKDPYRLCALMGWSSVEMADKYVRLNPQNLTHFYQFGNVENAYDANITYHTLYLEECARTAELRKQLEERNV